MPQFPASFTFGSATSSYQIEGAWQSGGKGLSIWDAFAHTPSKTHNGDHGNRACNHYHLYKEDVAMMAKLGLKAYRFSIAWARIMPTGEGKVNEEGIQFYSDLIDELLANGIEPWVTLYHWDLPLALQMEHDGWLSPKIIDFFEKYASVCFERFGDRVKHWITLNEPWVVAILGYGQGVFAPGRQSNSEPYLAAHHLLLAHAKAFQCYKTHYYPTQKGTIGITNNCDWREPLTESPEDKAAAERALQFFLAWFADPVYFGDYPQVMKDRVGNRLPKFTDDEKALLQGSSNFFGLNHYTTLYASHIPANEDYKANIYGNGGISEDQAVRLTVDKNWQQTTMNWAIVPWGCRKLLEWIKARYDNPPIYITENGCSLDDKVINGEVDDTMRLDFYQSYLIEAHKAMENGVNLQGYFAWSLMDNFEWALGYSKRFGMVHVDFETMERVPKRSAIWYGKLCQSGKL